MKHNCIATDGDIKSSAVSADDTFYEMIAKLLHFSWYAVSSRAEGIFNLCFHQL